MLVTKGSFIKSENQFASSDGHPSDPTALLPKPTQILGFPNPNQSQRPISTDTEKFLTKKRERDSGVAPKVGPPFFFSLYFLTMSATPTRQNVEKILANLTAKEGLIYLRGQVLSERDDTDVELPFRQESNFFYVTGLSEPGFHVLIDIATHKIQLVSPNLDEDAVMWMGLPDDLDTLVQKYDVDEALYVDRLPSVLSQASVVYTLPITPTHTLDPSVRWCSEQDKKALYTAFAEARAIKSDWEVDTIRKANRISSEAHVQVSQRTKRKQS